MLQDTVRVTRSQEKTWNVVGGRTLLRQRNFRIKSHAVAFARAVSWSRSLTLFIDDDGGNPVRQSRESMTYPVRLD